MSRLKILSLSVVSLLSVAATARADYVTNVSSGHGPFACSGDTPPFGYADFYLADGTCQRYRGDVGPQYTHIGYVVTAPANTVWISVSPNNTYATVCSHKTDGIGPSPCGQQLPPQVLLQPGGQGNFNPAWGGYTWRPVAVIIGYYQMCPYEPGMAFVQQCTGDDAVEDGSGYLAVRVSDSFGNFLMQPNGSSLAVDCVVDLALYNLQNQVTFPANYAPGTRAVAAYANCE